MKRTLSLLLLTSLTLAAAQKVATPIPLGIAVAQTSNTALLGQEEVIGAKFAEKLINARGGVNGTPIKLVFQDTGGDVAGAINAFQNLVSKDKRGGHRGADALDPGVRRRPHRRPRQGAGAGAEQHRQGHSANRRLRCPRLGSGGRGGPQRHQAGAQARSQDQEGRGAVCPGRRVLDVRNRHLPADRQGSGPDRLDGAKIPDHRQRLHHPGDGGAGRERRSGRSSRAWPTTAATWSSSCASSATRA